MIKLNYLNVDKNVIGKEHGLEVEKEFAKHKDKIAQIITDLNKRKDKPGQWLQWMNLGYNEETVWYVKEFAAMVRGRFDNVLVLGIGGSALGGIAVSEALLKPYWNLLTPEQRDNYPRLFFLDNIDPDQITGLLNTIDLRRTLVNVITKSGSTAETISQFIEECNVMKNLRHPNILLYMGASTKGPDFFVVTEYCENGNLFEQLHLNRNYKLT